VAQKTGMQCQSIKMLWGIDDVFTSESHQVGIKRKDLMKNILTLRCTLIFAPYFYIHSETSHTKHNLPFRSLLIVGINC